MTEAVKPSVLGRINAWTERREGELRHSVPVTAAALFAFAVAETLALPQGYWAVFTAVLVTQASVGGSVKAALDWLVSTLGGGAYAAAVGTAVHWLDPTADAFSVAVGLGVALTPLAFLAAVRPTFRFAPVTGVIVILVAPVQHLSPLESAINRLTEISIGGAVGLVVSLMILPARASGILNQAAARALDNFAAVLPLLLRFDRAYIQHDLTARHDAALNHLAKLTLAVEEAKRERASFLSNEPDPEPVLRTLQRLRADIIMLGRATAEPLPDTFHDRLAEALRGAVEAIAASFRGIGASLEDRRPPPSLMPVEKALAHYAHEVAEVREAGQTRGLAGEAIGRTFAVGFALEQLKINLKDLASRTAERARKKQPSAA
ncbi:MAG: FUSC family protein [Rhodospirillaceae bacterium]|nr:FUSC family protein [Rhodospirillaceae bacterium]